MSPSQLERVLPAGPPGDQAALPGDRALPAFREREGRERLEQRGGLHHVELRQRRHRLRRVRVRAQLPLPGGSGWLNPGGYYVLPDRVERGDSADGREDQRRPEQRELPAAGSRATSTPTRTRGVTRCPSYSYFIVPRTPKPPPDLRQPVREEAGASARSSTTCCATARQHVDQIGYSPLPVNLVRGGFRQDSFIPGHGSIPSLSTLPNCHNPTFINGRTTLTKDAPFPTQCEQGRRAAELRGTERQGRRRGRRRHGKAATAPAPARAPARGKGTGQGQRQRQGSEPAARPGQQPIGAAGHDQPTRS